MEAPQEAEQATKPREINSTETGSKRGATDRLAHDEKDLEYASSSDSDEASSSAASDGLMASDEDNTDVDDDADEHDDRLMQELISKLKSHQSVPSAYMSAKSKDSTDSDSAKVPVVGRTARKKRITISQILTSSEEHKATSSEGSSAMSTAAMSARIQTAKKTQESRKSAAMTEHCRKSLFSEQLFNELELPDAMTEENGQNVSQLNPVQLVELCINLDEDLTAKSQDYPEKIATNYSMAYELLIKRIKSDVERMKRYHDLVSQDFQNTPSASQDDQESETRTSTIPEEMIKELNMLKATVEQMEQKQSSINALLDAVSSAKDLIATHSQKQ